MNQILKNLYYQNSLSDWGISIGIVILSFVVGRVVLWLFKGVFKKITAKTKSEFDDLILDMIEEPIVMAIVSSGIFYGLYRLKVADIFQKFLYKGYLGLLTLAGTWFLARTADALIEKYIIPLADKSENDLDDQLVPIIRKGINAGIWILGILVALNNAGFNVTALIAGMGIGGLALAMAAKDTVSNIFGGVTIFTDKPFKLNDRIRLGGHDGTICEIGVRSTRLRTLAGTIVTIPNTRFTDSMVENVTLEPSRKVILNLGLTYDTSPEAMEAAILELNKIANEHSSLDGQHKVAFNSYGDFSLGILFIYYIKKGEDILQTQTEINLSILKRFNENKWSFAFPTQTIELQK